MKKILLTFFSIAILGLVFFTPTEVVLADGFVTCSGTDCSFCNLVELANLVIKWLFGVIVFIFVYLLIIAGFGLITSAGNQSELNTAKSKFTNAIIGVLIVMGAWLFIDTIMKALLNGGNGEINGWGPWSQVECQDQTEAAFYDLNSGHSEVGGTVNVGTPGSQPPQNASSTQAGSCTIAAMSVINDEKANEMEQGATVIYPDDGILKNAVETFISKLSSKGISAHVNSAYRPHTYQTHLWEIRDRWCDKGLRYNNDLACSDMKSGVKAEVHKHFGLNWNCGAVAKNSKHSDGKAVDIGGEINHNSSVVKQAASESCLVWKNHDNDPWHYDLKGNCTVQP